MSVNTKAILFGDIHYEEIAARVGRRFGVEVDIETRDYERNGFAVLNFDEPDPAAKPGGGRRLFVFRDGSTMDDVHVFDGTRTCLLLGCWGSSTEIVTALAEIYGGYVNPSDSDPANWIAHAPSAERAPVDALTQLKVDLAALVPHAQAVVLSKISEDPAMIDALVEALTTYRAAAAAEEYAASGAEAAWELHGTVDHRGSAKTVWRHEDGEGKTVWQMTDGDAPRNASGYYDLGSLLSLKGIKMADVEPASVGPRP
jgi:hypothetical protein